MQLSMISDPQQIVNDLASGHPTNRLLYSEPTTIQCITHSEVTQSMQLPQRSYAWRTFWNYLPKHTSMVNWTDSSSMRYVHIFVYINISRLPLFSQGPLYFRVGSRLPPWLQKARLLSWTISWRADHGTHGNSNGTVGCVSSSFA
jgi:hypothetical protein